MRDGGLCPKCRQGRMYQRSFDSCNWYCELCGWKEYRPRPRPDIPRHNARMDAISRQAQKNHRQFEQNLRDMKQSAREYERAVKAKREAEKALRKAQKEGRGAKKAEKKMGLGTVLAILFLLWLLSRLL